MKFLSLLLSVGLCTLVLAKETKVEQTNASTIAADKLDMKVMQTDMKPMNDMKNDKQDMSDMKQEQHLSEIPATNVGDFIIHPLVAFRQRPAAKKDDAEDTAAGKQAEGVSSTTAAPWPVIGLGYGQVIGSQVSNLAGQLSSWINDRIQLPGIVESPVRDSTSTTTSTTPRPDVIVRVQHRPSISLNSGSRKRPNKISETEADSAEQDYEQDEIEDEDENEDQEYEFIDDEYEEEEEEVRPVVQRRPVRKQQQQLLQAQRRPQIIRTQHVNRPLNKRRRQQQNQFNNRFDDYAEDDSEDDYYYGPDYSSKRSQQNGFMQLGQQGLLNHIRYITRGQTPVPVPAPAPIQSTPEQHNTKYYVRGNGEHIYLAPEFLSEETQANDNIPNYHYQFQTPAKHPTQHFPQPPLTKPLKINGQIQQYITIPYNQLGIMPPAGAANIGEGLQSQPLILSIPQSALHKIQSKDKRDRPHLTANAVPLLTEASLADIFKPPQIPPSRTPPQMSAQKPETLTATYTPVVVLTQNGGTKIQGGTIVEKSPPSLNIKQVKTEEAYLVLNDDNEESPRQAKPKPGKARFYKLPKGGRFAVRNGRILDQTHSPAIEQHIPVHVIEGDKVMPEMSEVEKTKVESSTAAPDLDFMPTPAPHLQEEIEAQIAPTPLPDIEKTLS